jgi:hypothetical protein
LEFDSGRVECIKYVECPSLNRQKAIRGLRYQVFIQRRHGAALVQERVKGICENVQEASGTRYAIQFGMKNDLQCSSPLALYSDRKVIQKAESVEVV